MTSDLVTLGVQERCIIAFLATDKVKGTQTLGELNACYTEDTLSSTSVCIIGKIQYKAMNSFTSFFKNDSSMEPVN
jgi:hypothetical protein